MGLEISLTGHRALITGASRGLGPVIARVFAEAGAELILHCHQNIEDLKAIAATLPGTPILLSANLANNKEVQTLFESATRDGPVNVLVNCAAAESQDISALDDMTAERWDQTQSANVTAPMLLIRDFSKQSIPGSVINISSIEGSRPGYSHGHYATSKAALEMLTRSAALELGPSGIRVNAVAPGLINREGIEQGWPEGVNAWKSSAPLGKLVDPENIAAAAAFLASDLAASISGIVMTIDAGLSVKPGW